MVYSGPSHRQPWQDDEMVFTQYHIEQPTSYPEDYPERQEGEPAGPLTVMVAGRRGIDGDMESMALRTRDLVGKYSDNSRAEDAYETAQMQMEPGFQDRWREKLMREWFVSQRPLVNMVEHLDNEGVIRGYVVIMNMTDPETGVAKVNHRYVSMEEIVQRVGV
jgi:hypothetical protein